MKRIAIIGGGISGLSAAFYLERLRRAGAPIECTLFEASSRLGGVIKTERVHDFVIEAGPDSFLTSKPWAAELARDAGIGDQLLPSNDRKRKTYILDQKKLVPLPDGMQMMVPTQVWPTMTTPLLSFSTKLRMLEEYVAPPAPMPDGSDESVATFVRRHFGDEMVTKLAAPMLSGIYGGDANTLSARATLPSMVAMEATHRSLVRGTLKMMSSGDGQPRRSLFTSFRNGMQQLVDAVVAGIDASAIRLNTPVTALSPLEHGWSMPGSTEKFDEVIIALPAYATAKLLAFNVPLASLLESIRYTDTATVVLAYSCEKLRRDTTLPPGFGFLVPASEGRKVMACTFVHNKFDCRTGDDFVLLRAFLAGGLERSDSELIATVESELASILHIKSPTECARIYRWPQAMPQYEVGHLDKVAQITESLRSLGGLQLIGNAYRGLGIPDCVREGKLAAENAASH